MAYKQNNPISRGISYGPGDYQNPKNPMGSIEGTFDFAQNLQSGGKNQFNVEDKIVGSSVTGADGDETTKNKITPSDDSQKSSVPAAADLERIRKENIQEGNLQKNIMRLDKKSKDASISPRARRKAQEKLETKREKYKIKEGFQQGLKEARSDKREQKIEDFRTKKTDQLRKRSGLSKDERTALETGTEEKSPGVNFPEKNKYQSMAEPGLDFLTKMSESSKELDNLKAFESEQDPLIIENFSDDEFKKAQQSFADERQRKADEKFKASDAGYWESIFNPNKDQTNKYQPQMNLKHIKTKGTKFPQAAQVDPMQMLQNQNRAGGAMKDLTSTPFQYTDPSAANYRDPRSMSAQQFNNANQFSNIASAQGETFNTPPAPTFPNQQGMAMYGDHAHTEVTKENYKDAEKDDAAHMSYLKRDVKDVQHSDMSQHKKDEYETADEKHISKLAGDLKYDHNKFKKYDNVAMYKGPSFNPTLVNQAKEGKLNPGFSKVVLEAGPSMDHGPSKLDSISPYAGEKKKKMTNQEHRDAGHMFDYNTRQWKDKSGKPAMYDGPSSFKGLVKKLQKEGKSKEAATKIAGKVANYKRKGGGKGPTAKQKARMRKK